MKEFTISSNDCSQRLDKFILKAVPLLPKTLLYKYIRLKRIKVNNKRSEIAYKLQLGDVIQLYINDEYFEDNPKEVFKLVRPDIEIVYQDDNIMLVDKPLGLVVHEDSQNSVDTLINRVLSYLYQNNMYNPEDELSFAPALCNRIDRNTRGIVIVAKTAEALRIINDKIKKRQVDKFYLCVVSGVMLKQEDTLTHYHIKDGATNVVKVYDNQVPNSKTMITKYKTLKTSAENSLLEVELKTGRTHQIRVHLAHICHPLIGDGKYGHNSVNKKYQQRNQLLYSYKLKFSFEDEQPHALSYLNDKEFQVKRVWFNEEFETLF